MDRSDRPRIEITPTRRDKILDAISTAGVLFIIAYLLAVWSKLPARVPTHFGLSGNPDHWGSRNALLTFVIAPFVTYIALTILSRVPWVYNYPVKVTEENCERLYLLGRGMMLWVRTEAVWLFVLIGLQTVRVALGQAHGLGPVLGLGPLVAIYGTLIYYGVMMYRAGRNPQP